MGDYGCGLGWRLVVGSVCEREVGQSCDADRRRLNGGGCGDRFWLWDGVGFGWRGLRDLGFEILVRKSQGCDNWSYSGVFCRVRASWFWLPGLEGGWRR